MSEENQVTEEKECCRLTRLEERQAFLKTRHEQMSKVVLGIILGVLSWFAYNFAERAAN